MKTRYLISCAALAFAATASQAQSTAMPAAGTQLALQDAQPAGGVGLGEIVVTAQRRNESIQKVPLTIQAFTGQTLSQLNVRSFDDLVKYTPNVTFPSNGPGQGNVTMRGLSAGFAGGQSSSTIGNFPNVALYLDDQSMQFPARNIDVYAADIQRVEVLEGPQGTLFGGGAEAGAVRYITNKPNMERFEGHAEGMFGGTSGGAANNSETITLNVPVITDKLAVRATVYNERRGGYIDNVYSTFTRSNADTGNPYLNILPNGAGICPNGQPTQPTGGGFCTLPGVQINNGTTARKNFNPATYTGGRIEAQWNINENWNLLVTESIQHLDADGLSVEYPVGSDFQKLDPLQVTSFVPNYDHDKFASTAWTLHGQAGPLSIVYTGSFLNRHIDNQIDYTNYSRTAYGTYYTCVGGSTPWQQINPATGAKVPTPASCYSPATYWRDKVKNTHLSNELRVSTPADKRIRVIAGAFQETFKIQDVMNFEYKNIPSCTPTNLSAALAGGAPCVANVRTFPGANVNDPGIRDDNTGFGEDVKRGYSQYAFFGSVDFDIIPDVLTVTGGTRYYHYKEYEFGAQYGTGASCLDVPNGSCTGGMIQIGGPNGDHVTYHGFKNRASLNWHVNKNTLAYFTFSQGFRPGGFNRSQRNVAKDGNGVPQYRTPNGYAPDSLNNYEVGVKTSLFNHRLQVNLSAYDMDWSNVQFAFYAPAQLGNTTFLTNGPDYNIKGVEIQAIATPIQGITLQGTLSYNHNKQTSSPCLPANLTANPTACITEINGSPIANLFGALGATAAFSPKVQASGDRKSVV